LNAAPEQSEEDQKAMALIPFDAESGKQTGRSCKRKAFSKVSAVVQRMMADLEV
jgi:hypothetical protein